MITSPLPLQFAVVQLGDLNRVEISNALGLANQLQRDFYFEMLDHVPKIDVSSYRLPNDAYDLDAALVDWTKHARAPRRTIGVSGNAYGDAHSTGPDDLFFMNLSVRDDEEMFLISTHLWSTLPGQRPLQPYLLCGLASIVLSHCGGLHVHAEARGCVFDYCEQPETMSAAVTAGRACDDCARALNKALRQSRVSNSQIASANRLLQRAAGRKHAFLVMPFRRELATVQQVVGEALGELGWTVTRGDKIAQPRRITDAIVQAILAADLVVADITAQNANVFYELGLAHASAADVIMLTQDRRIPFDVTTERAIQYTTSARGLKTLKTRIREMVAPG